jgi:hypothetical protein
MIMIVYDEVKKEWKEVLTIKFKVTSRQLPVALKKSPDIKYYGQIPKITPSYNFLRNKFGKSLLIELELRSVRNLHHKGSKYSRVSW